MQTKNAKLTQVKAQLIALKEEAGLDFQTIAGLIGCRIETITRIKQSGKAGRTNRQKIEDLYKQHFSRAGEFDSQWHEIPTECGNSLHRQVEIWCGDLGILRSEFEAECLARFGRHTFEAMKLAKGYVDQTSRDDSQPDPNESGAAVARKLIERKEKDDG